MMNLLEAIARFPWPALGVGVWLLLAVYMVLSTITECVALRETGQRPPRLPTGPRPPSFPTLPPPDGPGRSLSDLLQEQSKLAAGTDEPDEVRGRFEQSPVWRVN